MSHLPLHHARVVPGAAQADSTQSNSSDSNSEDDEDDDYTNSRGWCQNEIVATVQDVIASVVFWYVLIFAPYPFADVPITYTMFYSFCGGVVVLMILWRIYRARWLANRPDYPDIPYTCGYVKSNDKELFIVATLHVSPRAPRDVCTVIDTMKPDVAMIELDEERLDRMRHEDVEQEVPQVARKDDLQPIRITWTQSGQKNSETMYAQRAVWNGEFEGASISGEIAFDPENAYALTAMGSDAFSEKVALVRRGSPNQEFAPFALKAHSADRGGAVAVIVSGDEEALPVHRIGGGAVMDAVRVAVRTCNCGFPPIPVMLLARKDGERLHKLCELQPPARAELKVLSDRYPRRTLGKKLCQGCALMCTGIGILYGIIQCFGVEVGAEFTAAEQSANSHGIPCVCIDVNLNQFWTKLGYAVLPTPCNCGKSFLALLAFPRVFFRVLFPARESVDVIGSMFLHVGSFYLRTWVAFTIACICASFVTNNLLKLFGYGATEAAVDAGVVQEDNTEEVQTYIMLAVEVYALPRIFNAIATSRDETMYCSIVAKSREMMAQRMVVVVGAAHSNGILQRIRTRGL